MPNTTPLIEKFDHYLMQGLRMAVLLLGVYGMGWGAVILLMQALGWAVSGEWQPVALHSLFLAPEAQSSLRLYSGASQPLQAVPALGPAYSLDDLTLRIAGQMVGLRRVWAWLLDLPLSAWLLVASLVLLATSGLGEKSVRVRA